MTKFDVFCEFKSLKQLISAFSTSQVTKINFRIAPEAPQSPFGQLCRFIVWRKLKRLQQQTQADCTTHEQQ